MKLVTAEILNVYPIKTKQCMHIGYHNGKKSYRSIPIPCSMKCCDNKKRIWPNYDESFCATSWVIIKEGADISVDLTQNDWLVEIFSSQCHSIMMSV